MTRGVITVASLALVCGTPIAWSQSRGAYEVVTTERGAFIVPREAAPADGQNPFARGIAWSFFDVVAIPESCALAPSSDSAWVAQNLNSIRVQRFDISGTGIPDDEYPVTTTNAVGVAAAQGADLAASLSFEGGVFVVRTYTTGGAGWNRSFPANYNQGNLYYNVDVSRDGSTVAVALHDQAAYMAHLWILNGNDGSIRQTWSEAGAPGGVDLTDDGSLCLVTHQFFQDGVQRDRGKVIDTATGTQIFEGLANAAGGRFPISGDGRTFATGAFNMRIYHNPGTGYVQTRLFSAANSWFGWGLAASRDGSTVGVMSHDYASGYLLTSTRVFDAATGNLLGTYNTAGTGPLQGAVAGAAMNEDGTRLAVAHWGTADGETPEVLVLDRSAALVGSIDTVGSVFSLDMSDSGRYVLAGNKNVHANTNGNGGTTNLLDLGSDCPADFDGDGFVTGIDYDLYVAAFEAGEMSADFDGDGFITGIDFDLYVGAFEAGCE